jgi:hypothetical protein
MTVDPNPFESPHLLLDGATRHIEALERRVDDLRQTPDWVAIAPDAEGGYFISANIRIPPDMKQIAFDIVSNLRSALDHAVFAGTLALTGDERSNTKFPIGDTEQEARADVNRSRAKVPAELLDFLLAFNVHRDGNITVWALNKLRNTKSHRVLVPFASTVDYVGESASPGTKATHEWDKATGRFKMRFEQSPIFGPPIAAYTFRLHVLIGTGTFSGEPALAVFGRMFGEVERIISAIEAETTRLIAERS